MEKIVICILIILVFLNIISLANKNDAILILGYIDKDHNGINDLYYDKNGDGINDIDNKIVFPKIKFQDNDSNNINDLYIDEDGDGVNDIYIFSNQFHIIDINKDGYNDITGVKYKKGFYRGFLMGNIIEENGKKINNFVDKNNDYMDDNIQKYLLNKIHDKFVDKDNDGICDGREEGLNPRKGRGGGRLAK